MLWHYVNYNINNWVELLPVIKLKLKQQFYQ